MKRSMSLAVCLATVLCTAGAFAQAPTDLNVETTPDGAPPAPVAFIYVSNITNPNALNLKENVYAYTAAANGKLTPAPGSPFNDDIFSMAVNGRYLFGGDGTNGDIDTFLMAPNGALHKVETINPAVYNPGAGSCGSGVDFKIDHSGTMLYNNINDPDCFGSHFQFFKIQSATGKLVYAGETPEIDPADGVLSFIGTNKFAFASDCQFFDGEASGGVDGYTRLSNGTLDHTYSKGMADDGVPGLGPVAPPEPGFGNSTFYCPQIFAPDPANHMAALLQLQDDDGDLYGNPVIAVYTVGANGTLSTISTHQNMLSILPSKYFISYSMRMAPSGKLLAVGGLGLQIFHFNGGNPVTKYQTLLPTEDIQNVYWDNNNHLYAIGRNSPNTGKLYVFTVTPTSITEAPGSPYKIPNPYLMITQPK